MIRNIIIVLVLVLAAAGIGFYYGRGDKQIEIHEIKGETHVEFRDRIVTVTKTIQKDGTVIETTKTEEINRETDIKVVEKDSKSTPVTSKYSLSLGITSLTGLASPYDPSNYYVGAGTRVFGPVWLEGSVRGDKSITLGIRYEL